MRRDRQRIRILPIEQLDDRLRKARELVKRGNERFSFRHPRLIDRYREGTCNLGLTRSLADERQLGFIVSAYPAGHDWLNRLSGNPEKCGGWFDPDQPTMLTHDVELMEGPEKFVPSAVRFQRFDDRSFGRGQPLFAFETYSQIPPGLENGEVGFAVIRHAVACRERTGEDVEAAANRIDVGSDLDVERERKRLFLHHHYDVVRAIRVRVFNCHFEVELEPSNDPRLQGWELGYGPVNACLSV